MIIDRLLTTCSFQSIHSHDTIQQFVCAQDIFQWIWQKVPINVQRGMMTGLIAGRNSTYMYDDRTRNYSTGY